MAALMIRVPIVVDSCGLFKSETCLFRHRVFVLTTDESPVNNIDIYMALCCVWPDSLAVVKHDCCPEAKKLYCSRIVASTGARRDSSTFDK